MKCPRGDKITIAGFEIVLRREAVEIFHPLRVPQLSSIAVAFRLVEPRQSRIRQRTGDAAGRERGPMPRMRSFFWTSPGHDEAGRWKLFARCRRRRGEIVERLAGE